MLTRLLRFTLTQRLFVLVLGLAVVFFGLNAWFNIPIDAFPDISPTQVKIIIKAPGMTTEEIEAQVTQPIETELLGIPAQQMLRSTTKYAITDITLDFKEGTEIYWARQQVTERLANVWDSLPTGISGGIAPMSTPLSEMFMFTVENPAMSLMERRQLLDWEIRPLLRTVNGVAEVNVLGGYAKTYQISPDPQKMANAGVSFASLSQSIQANNLNGSIGRLDIGNDAIILRTEGRIDSITSLEKMVVHAANGNVYRLGDLSTVSISHLARYGSVTRNGIETTEAIVISLKNANTAEVVAGVRQKLAEITPSLPSGTKLNVFYDRANLIDTAIGTITTALIAAVVLVVLLLAFFLGDIRAAITVSLSLPFAALSTFILMDLYGLSANLMSLGGLVIAIGMIVDSSVVIVENVVNQLAKNSKLPKLHLIFRACKEVAIPVVSGTIIVVIVFSPLLSLSGLEGKLFTPVALTIVFAMLSALVLSLTLVPTIASLILKTGASKEPKLVAKIQQYYQASLVSTLSKPMPLIVVVILVLTVSVGLFTLLGKTFMPVLDEGDIIVQLEKSPSISLSSSTELDMQIEKALLENVPEIKQIVARVGSDEIGLDPMSLNETDIFMELLPIDEWRFDSKAELIEDIRSVLSRFPGINFGFTQPIQMRVSEMLTGSTGDVSVKVFGTEINTLSDLASQISQLIKTLDGSVDVNTAIIEGGQFLNVRLKPEIAMQYDMTVDDMSIYLRAQFESVEISKIIQGKKKTPLVFGMNKQLSTSVSTLHELQSMTILMPDGSLMPFDHIALLELKQGPSLVERENGNRFSVVTSNVIDRDIVGYVDELRLLIDSHLTLPAGYTLAYGGEFENQQRAMNNLLMVVPIALSLILLILFTTFGSLPKALLILLNIPFALMGGVIALYISSEYLSVPASVGFIALLGIAVLNGVVMVSYFEQIKLTMTDTSQRVIEGSIRRLRPVLMTATTAMFGLAPLIFASGPGAEIQKPLAIVVIGGLVTSTITTLYLLPLFYMRMENKRNAK